MRKRFLFWGVLVSILVAPQFVRAAESGADPGSAFAGLSAWNGGAETKSLAAVRAYVDRATKDYKTRQDAEARLVAVIESPGVSKAAKQFAGDQLYRLCDEDSIPAFERVRPS